MKIITTEKNIKPFPVAIVVSRFNSEITENLLRGALQRLEELTIAKHLITVVWVPGAIEIPLIAQQLANTKQYDAVICLGAVIRGDTDHYDYVCQQVSYGCQKVALESQIPIIFGVLTTNNEQQAYKRAAANEDNKGRYAADAAAEMVAISRQLRGI